MSDPRELSRSTLEWIESTTVDVLTNRAPEWTLAPYPTVEDVKNGLQLALTTALYETATDEIRADFLAAGCELHDGGWRQLFSAIAEIGVEEVCQKLELRVNEQAAAQAGRRVVVTGPSGTDEPAYGMYVGDFPAVAVFDPAGAIVSIGDATGQAPDVPEGGQIIEMPANPKIILDDGRVVRGCQVWWKFADE